MGSSASKASRAAGSAARQYPKWTPSTSHASNAPQARPPPAPNHAPGPTVKPQPQASSTRSEAINLDASDPDFARSLRSLGPVQPNPTMSETSTFPHPSNYQNPKKVSRPTAPDPRQNPAIRVLDSRQRLQDEAEMEFMEAGRRGHQGRQFLDVFTIRQMLTMRDEQGKSAAAIEKTLGLKDGAVERLGPKGVFGVAQEMGRAEKEVHVV
ncbi:hypothetical protein LTR37_009496 [Vermiconidia calcicola]|uniref:Uncharacterized protein n=1 Tax=Vermiconidia calcicola TaxID=1690605 RepID=A0ACC3N8F9_9PEZI|nr:hypothetical protein LTR37_009496 [Vermiconidia calcicola]